MKKILSFIIKSANLWVIMNIIVNLPLLGAAFDGMKTHAFNDDSIASARDIGSGPGLIAQAEDCECGDCDCECDCDCDC